MVTPQHRKCRRINCPKTGENRHKHNGPHNHPPPNRPRSPQPNHIHTHGHRQSRRSPPTTKNTRKNLLHSQHSRRRLGNNTRHNNIPPQNKETGILHTHRPHSTPTPSTTTTTHTPHHRTTSRTHQTTQTIRRITHQQTEAKQHLAHSIDDQSRHLHQLRDPSPHT